MSSVKAELDLGEVDPELPHSLKMVALGELASGIVHDFRNILQTASALMETIGDRSNDPREVRRLIASALVALDRGKCVTERLANFSRTQVIVTRPACLLSCLESAADTFASTVEGKLHIAIEPLAKDLWQAIIDPTELELTLLNLGNNARDAMPDGGFIRFAAYNVTIPAVDRRGAPAPAAPDGKDRRGPQLLLPGGDYIAIVVGDTGAGMDKATLERAVNPFFTTKPVGKGTGLGLAMAHALAIQAGGAFRLISEIGQGTRAEIWLPRAEASISLLPEANRIAA